MKNSKVKLKLILPHFFSAKWKVQEVNIKVFIKTYGYWAWQQSSPTLKIHINDKSIMGEQESFFIHLNEGDSQCAFFVPHDDKKYKVEYGRLINENVFIPITYSDYFFHPNNECYSVFPLPDDFTKDLPYGKLMENASIN